MFVHCPSCGRQLAANDLDISTGLARCRPCSAVFSFAEAAHTAAAPRAAPIEHGTYPQPSNLSVASDGQTWGASWSWRSATLFFLIPFTIAWDSFLIFWYSMALGGHAPWLMIVFPIAHVAAGVGLTYAVVAGLLNRTNVWTDGGALTIWHGPIHGGAPQRLARGEADTLFVRLDRNVYAAEDGSFGRYGRGCPTGTLFARLRSGSERPLLKRTDPNVLLYLRQELLPRLGLPDAPVAGAYRGA